MKARKILVGVWLPEPLAERLRVRSARTGENVSAIVARIVADELRSGHKAARRPKAVA